MKYFYLLILRTAHSVSPTVFQWTALLYVVVSCFVTISPGMKTEIFYYLFRDLTEICFVNKALCCILHSQIQAWPAYSSSKPLPTPQHVSKASHGANFCIAASAGKMSFDVTESFPGSQTASESSPHTDSPPHYRLTNHIARNTSSITSSVVFNYTFSYGF